VIVKDVTNTTSAAISTQTTSSTTAAAPVVWGSSSQKSWADLFKDGSAIHSSTLSSQTSGGATTGPIIVSHNYNNVNLSESDSHLNSSGVISESEAQIQCIPMRNDSFARKLSKKVKELHLKHFLPYLIPSGFINRGNWCYINATLQALVGCPPFYNLMREIGDISGLFRERSSTPIIDSFAKFFNYLTPCDHLTRKQKSGANLATEDMPRGEPIEPRCIYDVLGSIKSECLKGRQEDAEEFLSSVLNGLHEEMIALLRLMADDNENKAVNGQHSTPNTLNGHIGKEPNGVHFADIDPNDSNNEDDDSNLWKEVSSRHKPMPTRSAKVISTPIFDIFGGSTLSIRTAGKDVCGNRQPFFALQLDIQSDRVKSVEDALKCLTTSESIQGYMCPKTKQAMDASAQTFLDTLPPILILHLKLFVYDMDGGCRKLMKRIEYPVDLELPRECLHYDKWEREKNLQLKRYKLLSVVYHDGSEAIKGHYVTDVYHIGSNQWLRCDDQSVKVIPTLKQTHTSSSTPIFDIFGGSTLSIRTAGKDVCGNRQPFFALQLDIQSDRVKSVEDALKCLTTSESIQGYMCPKTKQAMDASAQTFLDTLPPILILHLKLFVYDMDGGCRKLMKRIEYPVDLELPRECLHYDKWEREKNLQLKRYKLLSVVYHDGSEAIKGHYVTDVYHIGSNQWLRCDDQSVKVIPTLKVLNTDTSRTPYLLFYRRHDTLYSKHTLQANHSKTFSH
ncbi:unnamed protein product, partial [Oppiella nova]